MDPKRYISSVDPRSLDSAGSGFLMWAILWGTRVRLVTMFQIAISSVMNAQVDPSKPELVLQTINISVYPWRSKSQQTMVVSIENEPCMDVQVVL